MINDHGETMIEHHTHYKEIHGYDKTVWMTKSEHGKLHYRLRKEEKCNIPADVLNRISIAANGRSEKGKQYRKQYIGEYTKRNRSQFDFYENMMHNVRLHEQIYYNIKTENVSAFGYFMASNNKKLYFIDIN